MMTMLAMVGRARGDGDNDGGGGRDSHATHARTNMKGALADRLSRPG